MAEEKYEEHKGYIIAPGLTMPSHGIHDYDVYMNYEDFLRSEPTWTCLHDRGEAVALVDRLASTSSRVGEVWWSKHDYTESPAPYVSPVAKEAVSRMPEAAQDIFRMVAGLEDTTEPGLRESRANEVLERMQALGVSVPELPLDLEPGSTEGSIENKMLRHYMSEDEFNRFRAEIHVDQ